MLDETTKIYVKETFWNNHKNIKRKTTQKEELKAQVEQMDFCKEYLSDVSDEELAEIFGNYAGYVKRWINAELVKNRYGKHLYVRLG